MTSELQLAIETAESAGTLTLSFFNRKSLEVFSKRDASPVTEADRSAEELIRTAIASRFPLDGLLGEEFEEKPSKNGRRWIIDPIDGTRSFIHGVPLYGVMIALEEDCLMRIGVISFPALGQLFYAEKGGGAYMNGDRISVSPIGLIGDATVVFTEKEYLLDPISSHPVDLLRTNASLVRGWGDCYGHMLVASGRADVAVDKIMSPWDCAAVIPIVTEAGGNCFDYRGNTVIDGQGLVSCNAALGSVLLKAIREGERA
ncbi:MAG: histidinol-phosphatase [Chlorobium sp.]|uniref:histidinol-phosphatase n=1 Tax=Chlorobium sp. TaxID=1095 RepID=UPI0025C10E55|nr:histidinol-phosphatase [Chlorobium sp.]MCF8216596.1 histidinol-phosphatase [Chlorobium sp.]MCF8271466.1 histidinol-phosphatase [Chlorobium sp.]MCF8287838.1 histidinol-phosphatase [Chlorobium sp.]MCF8291378.1 histidinol-phosphatase [Chlorobium sp.]MCF8385507.1 histidinol-phosphatase [Chlorobium sp.]